MPTENRSSNTEMVSVPREPTREMLAAAREVTGIFPRWYAMVAAAPDQQNQVPVGALLIDEYFDSREVGDVDIQLDSEVCEQLAAKYPGQSLPIYVHPAPADIGEVERLRAEVTRLDLLVAQADYSYDEDRANFKRQLAERDALLGSAKSALCHLLHNIKISGKRLDLGLAKDSADTVITLINALKAEAES